MLVKFLKVTLRSLTSAKRDNLEHVILLKGHILLKRAHPSEFCILLKHNDLVLPTTYLFATAINSTSMMFKYLNTVSWWALSCVYITVIITTETKNVLWLRLLWPKLTLSDVVKSLTLSPTLEQVARQPIFAPDTFEN